MKRTMMVAIVAGVLAVVTGCSGSDGVARVNTVNSEHRHDADTDTSGQEAAEASGQDATEAVESSTTPAVDTDAGGSLASASAQLQHWQTGEGVPMRIDVTGLARNGDLVELSMTLANENPPNPGAQSGEGAYVAVTAFTDPTRLGHYGANDVSGVSLVDQNQKKLYLPAIDSEDVCVCTVGLDEKYIQPGESLELSATFGGLPADVSQVDLHVPGFEPITGLAIQG